MGLSHRRLYQCGRGAAVVSWAQQIDQRCRAMEPPFPGMDPYLEAPSLWPDAHTSLISTIRDQLQPALVPRYKAVITPYMTLESIEIAPTRRAIMPDIGVLQRDEPGTGASTVAIVRPALSLPAVMEIPTRYARLEIRSVSNDTLVTAIELLSPANKRPGAEGAEAYEKKRQELFRSDAHLLEIDLLRGGQRPRLTKPLPPVPYFVFLSRSYRRPLIDIWPLSLQTPLPVIPVPLPYPEPDVPLDLTRALQYVYRSARYDLQVDYRQPPPPPELSADGAAWLDTHLRRLGLRP